MTQARSFSEILIQVLDIPTKIGEEFIPLFSQIFVTDGQVNLVLNDKVAAIHPDLYKENGKVITRIPAFTKNGSDELDLLKIQTCMFEKLTSLGLLSATN